MGSPADIEQVRAESATLPSHYQELLTEWINATIAHESAIEQHRKVCHGPPVSYPLHQSWRYRCKVP